MPNPRRWPKNGYRRLTRDLASIAALTFLDLRRIENHPWLGAAIVAIGVFIASWLGIQTRLAFGLASVWVANGLLLGTLIRIPWLATPQTALFAFLGYVAADFAAGSDTTTTLVLTAANMAGVYCALFAARHVPAKMRRMTDPASAFYMLGVIGIEALAAAVVGGPLVSGDLESRVFRLPALAGFELFLFSEFSFTAITLPVVLFMSEWRLPELNRRVSAWTRARAIGLPLLVLAASMIVAVRLGGIGAIAIPLPALVWCAIVLPAFFSASLNAAVACWMLWALPAGLFPTTLDLTSVDSVSSLRLGAAMLAVAPFAVITLHRSWNHVRLRLEHSAFTDALTGLLNRGTLTDRALAALEERPNDPRFALLMIDIDHFKQINDTFGHGIGDRVIRRLADIMIETLGTSALMGRFGGEEFVVLMVGSDWREAVTAAENLRARVEGEIAIPDGPARVTISVGVAARTPESTLDSMLVSADEGLYAAKAAGRNKVILGKAAHPEHS